MPTENENTETKKGWTTHTNPVLVHHAMPLFTQNSKVKAFETDSQGYKIIGLNDKPIIESSDIVVGLRWLWDQGLSFHLPMCGKYSLSIRPKHVNYRGKPCFQAVVVKLKQLAEEHYAETEYYNCLDGYWYQPEYKASQQVKNKLKTYPIQSIFNVLRMFNARQT